MPWAMPPWRWPSASSGLRIRPASSQATRRRSRTSPGLGVDVDDGHVGAEGERRLRGAEVAARPRRCRRRRWRPRSSCGTPTARRRRGTRRLTGSSTMSSTEASSRFGGDRAGLVDHRRGGLEHGRAAELQRARAEGAGAPRHEVGVAVDHRDALHRDAEGVAGDHGEAGVVALAVRRRSGEHGGRAVGAHRDLGVLVARARSGGDLDVAGHADAEGDDIASGAPAPPARHGARRSRRPGGPHRGRPGSRRSRRWWRRRWRAARRRRG